MAQSSGRTGGGALWAGALLLALIVTSIAQSADNAAAAKAKPADPKQVVLRLHDLPPGYEIENDGACDDSEAEATTSEEGPPPALLEWLSRHDFRGCSVEYERLYPTSGQGPNPRLVETSAITVATDAAIAEGFAIFARLQRNSSPYEPSKEVASPEIVGDATRLFHTANYEGRNGPGSLVLWRSGHVLAMMQVAGNRQAANDRIALLLAHRQQARIEQPQPYTEEEFDDSLVPLENPAIRFPVYWLGKTFQPGEGLPESELAEAFGPRPGPPWERLELWYAGSPALSTWTLRGWERFRKIPYGRMVWTWPCARSWTLQIPEGHAVIYNGYGRKFRTCPRKASRLYLAHVYIGRMVLGVNLPLCEFCLKMNPFGREEGPYSSLKGMKAIARGLHLRPKGALAEASAQAGR